MSIPTIRIPKWSDFQHYKDRSPPWIKLHRKLLHKREWRALSDFARGLLPELWMLASESDDGAIESDTDDLGWRLRYSSDRLFDIASALVELERYGFVRLSDHDAGTLLSEREQTASASAESGARTPTPPVSASTSLADRKHDARPEERRGEVEKEGDSETEGETDARARELPVDQSVDPFTDMLEDFPDAGAVLKRLKHPGGKHSTAAAIRTRLLYTDDGLMGDPCVKGLSLERRKKLVAVALVEYAAAGEKEFRTRHFFGFVGRLKRAEQALADREHDEAKLKRQREELHDGLVTVEAERPAPAEVDPDIADLVKRLAEKKAMQAEAVS